MIPAASPTSFSAAASIAAPTTPTRPDPVAATPSACGAGVEDRSAAPRASPQPALPAVRGGSAAREPGAQQALGRLQQGQAWLQRLERDMRALAGALATGSDSSVVDEKLAALQSSWAQRSDAAGQVDAQLRVQLQGEARQLFRLRGLDASALADAGNGRETLTLAVPGHAQRIRVTLDPAAGEAANLQQLQRALAPAGIGVRREGESLLLSVHESRWPALRQGMNLMGEGRRYPSGQLVRAPLEAQGEALTPAQWRLDSAQGRRQAMAQLQQAHAAVLRGGRQFEAALAQALPEREQAAQEAVRLQSFAEAFGREAGTASELWPALSGLGRQRVCQLLRQGAAI